MIEVVHLVEKLIEGHKLVHDFARPLDTIKEELFNVALDDDDGAHTIDLFTNKFKGNFAKLREIMVRAEKQATESFANSKQ